MTPGIAWYSLKLERIREIQETTKHRLMADLKLPEVEANFLTALGTRIGKPVPRIGESGFYIADGNVAGLVLHDMKIKSLPDELGELKELKYLDLDNNLLDSLPESIGRLKSLEILCVAGNRLRSLPASIGNLENATYMDFEGNDLETVPEDIGRIQKLQTLKLARNPLRRIPRKISEIQDLVLVDISCDTGKGIIDIDGKLTDRKDFMLLRGDIDRSSAKFVVKIAILGEKAIGKSNFARNFITESNNLCSMQERILKIFSKRVVIGKNEFVVELHEIGSNPSWESLQPRLLTGMDGAIVGLDMTKMETVTMATKRWLPVARLHDKHLPVVIIGMKADATNQVNRDQFIQYRKNVIKQRNVQDFVATSSKTGENICSGVGMILKAIFLAQGYDNMINSLKSMVPSQMDSAWRDILSRATANRK